MHMRRRNCPSNIFVASHQSSPPPLPIFKLVHRNNRWGIRTQYFAPKFLLTRKMRSWAISITHRNILEMHLRCRNCQSKRFFAWLPSSLFYCFKLSTSHDAFIILYVTPISSNSAYIIIKHAKEHFPKPSGEKEQVEWEKGCKVQATYYAS